MTVNIFPIPIGVDTVYIVQDQGVILIDGGDPGHMGKFMAGMRKLSVDPQDIGLIALTHGHYDHIGLAKEIKDISGAMILMNRQDIHLIGEMPPPQPAGFTNWGKFVIEYIKISTKSVHIPTFSVDIETDEEDISLADYGISGKVVYTPGHTSGSVSILLESGEVFVGDLAMNMFPLRLSPGLPIFGDDKQIIKKSWRKLLKLGVKTVYPAHGKPFPAEVLKNTVK
jgi:hydroxyacylglutathione hydrolase